jgi:hypothetical protein
MMTRSAVCLLSLALLSTWSIGCTSDPCASTKGTCVTLTVHGPGGARVDRLRVSVAELAPQESMSKATALPVEVALALRADISGMTQVTVVGYLGGDVVGSDSKSLSITSGQHHRLEVDLHGGPPVGEDAGADMAGSDMAGSDMAGSDMPPVTCTASCRDDSTLLRCNGDGSQTAESCDVGCSVAPTAHCQTIAPLAPVTADDLQITGLSTITFKAGTTYLVNTDDGSITNVRPPNTMRSQTLSGIAFRYLDATNDATDRGWGVFVFGDAVVEDGAIVKLTGARAAVLVSLKDWKVAGVIDGRAIDPNTGNVCGVPGAPGAGGFAGGVTVGGSPTMPGTPAKGAGPGGGTRAVAGESGGAGGGHGGVGGVGGQAGSSAANAGGKIDYTLPIAPVHGGSGGGTGHIFGEAGGGGGGAVHLVALHAVTIGGGASAGGINVGGCGGRAGTFGGGAGGGAGGTILIESPSVSLLALGRLAANGGGGGAHTANGGNGGLDEALAPGGTGDATYASGGAGGGNSTLHGDGSDGSSTGSGQSFAGGGGGAAGIIVIRNLSGSLVPPPQTIISPTLNLKNNAMQLLSFIGRVDIR